MSIFRSSLPRLASATLAVALLLLAAGCAAPTVPLAAAPPDMFDDARFGPPKEPIDPADVFRLTPQMQEYLDRTIRPLARVRGVRAALVDALYTRSKLMLEYDSSMTRTAAQAFEARQGNCLSLVIMTGAFASALDLDVTYQEVATDEMWSRSGGMYFMSGHVNLTFSHRYEKSAVYTIDFMPVVNDGLYAQPISRDTLLAMFMNNRAAEAMAGGQLDDAYWRIRQAVKLDPQFRSAYNTLGVIYLRHGDVARAEEVLHYVLDGAPDNPRVLTNYASALRQLGRAAEASAVEAHLAAVEPVPPFYWFVQGQAALRQGDFLKARELFLKEIARDPDYHEFHYALAVADFSLNRLDEASAEMKLAMTDAVKRSDHDLYAAKLDRLKAWRANNPPGSLVQ
jgi:tetratricopeptide (TPR) repeat protein